MRRTRAPPQPGRDATAATRPPAAPTPRRGGASPQSLHDQLQGPAMQGVLFGLFRNLEPPRRPRRRCSPRASRRRAILHHQDVPVAGSHESGPACSRGPPTTRACSRGWFARSSTAAARWTTPRMRIPRTRRCIAANTQSPWHRQRRADDDRRTGLHRLRRHPAIASGRLMNARAASGTLRTRIINRNGSATNVAIIMMRKSLM